MIQRLSGIKNNYIEIWLFSVTLWSFIELSTMNIILKNCSTYVKLREHLKKTKLCIEWSLIDRSYIPICINNVARKIVKTRKILYLDMYSQNKTEYSHVTFYAYIRFATSSYFHFPVHLSQNDRSSDKTNFSSIFWVNICIAYSFFHKNNYCYKRCSTCPKDSSFGQVELQNVFLEQTNIYLNVFLF